MNKVQKFLQKVLLGSDKLVYLNNINEPMPPNGLSDAYLFDFLNYGADNAYPVLTMAGTGEDSNERIKTLKSQKIKIKPVDVLNELEKTPTAFSLLNIDDKIYMLKEKVKLINQYYAKREIEGLLERLENRKKYAEHKEFFDKFDNTTEEKIDKLLVKYDLVRKNADIFIPEFPDDAIRIMKEYTEKMVLICNKKPVFYVIAEDSKFKKVYERNDPILLVQSPFGFFWQILGAYDQELLLLSEL